VKILVPIDGSAASLRALQYVTSHAGAFGSDITLIHVHLPVPAGRASSWVGKDALNTYYTEESDEALAGAKAHLDSLSIKANIVKCVGDPGTEVAKAAGACDLIVMGSQGRTALGNLVMGSVATRTIAQSKVPVLLVK
jgi:nucleotide-binding universal stress UspA family protein